MKYCYQIVQVWKAVEIQLLNGLLQGLCCVKKAIPTILYISKTRINCFIVNFRVISLSTWAEKSVCPCNVNEKDVVSFTRVERVVPALAKGTPFLAAAIAWI